MPFLLPQVISLPNCIHSSKLNVDDLSGKLSQAFPNYYSALYVPLLWDFSRFLYHLIRSLGRAHVLLLVSLLALGQVPFLLRYSKNIN